MIFKKELVKVYSHPRSGTHFLEAFLAQNFYKKEDLSIDKITWGHWSNRKVKEEGNLYGKLFGHHYFPSQSKFKKPGIYIVRDGRAVAYSVWKTSNFLHKDIDSQISFSDFLKMPLDWKGSPSKKSGSILTIFEHWAKHCNEWLELSKREKGLLVIFYEDLVNKPYETYSIIKNFHFKFKRKISDKELDPITKPTGLLPNEAKIDSWKEEFSNVDQELFLRLIEYERKYIEDKDHYLH
jgi:hypothetical protein